MPQAALAQVATRQGLAGAGHCAAAVHATHAVVPASQYGVPPPQATVAPHCPLGLQVCTPLPTHCFAFGVHAQHAPEPLHVPPAHVVPRGTGDAPQVLLVQVAIAQVLGGCGHWEAAVHATQVPLARSQTGVAPEQVGWAVYWPFAPHRRGTLPLHVLVDGVHPLHKPAPLHVPAPPPHVAPEAFAVGTQALPLQVVV